MRCVLYLAINVNYTIFLFACYIYLKALCNTWIKENMFYCFAIILEIHYVN